MVLAIAAAGDGDPARGRRPVLRRVPAHHVASWLTLLWVGLLGITACTLGGIAFSSVAKSGRSAPALVTPVALVLAVHLRRVLRLHRAAAVDAAGGALFPLKWMCQGMRAVFLPDAFSARRRPAAGNSARSPWSWPRGASARSCCACSPSAGPAAATADVPVWCCRGRRPLPLPLRSFPFLWTLEGHPDDACPLSVVEGALLPRRSSASSASVAGGARRRGEQRATAQIASTAKMT